MIESRFLFLNSEPQNIWILVLSHPVSDDDLGSNGLNNLGPLYLM